LSKPHTNSNTYESLCSSIRDIVVKYVHKRTKIHVDVIYDGAVVYVIRVSFRYKKDMQSFDVTDYISDTSLNMKRIVDQVVKIKKRYQK